MITKGIVVGIDESNPYKYKVRIPIYDKLNSSPDGTSDKNLLYATVSTLPFYRCNLTIEDVVFIGFENNSTNKPIILGVLYKEQLGESNVEADFSSVKVYESATLPKATHIGEVNPSEIEYLRGLSGNIQFQLDDFYNFVKDLSTATTLAQIRTIATKYIKE